MNLFKIVTKEVEHSPQFKSLNELKAFGPAKQMLNEICQPLKDKDGNFIQQFQTTAFYQRLWEIFLHSFFIENNFEIEDNHDRPDFHIKKTISSYLWKLAHQTPRLTTNLLMSSSRPL